MKTKRIYFMRTTHLGADGPSSLYYSTSNLAKEALKKYDNGETGYMVVDRDTILPKEGCTWNELCYWNDDYGEMP